MLKTFSRKTQTQQQNVGDLKVSGEYIIKVTIKEIMYDGADSI